ARDAAIGESALQALIDQALMRGVLIDDDERILGLGDDEGVVDLRPRGSERIERPLRIVLRDGAARVRARLGESTERGLRGFGEAKRGSAAGMRLEWPGR